MKTVLRGRSDSPLFILSFRWLLSVTSQAAVISSTMTVRAAELQWNTALISVSRRLIAVVLAERDSNGRRGDGSGSGGGEGGGGVGGGGGRGRGG